MFAGGASALAMLCGWPCFTPVSPLVPVYFLSDLLCPPPRFAAPWSLAEKVPLMALPPLAAEFWNLAATSFQDRVESAKDLITGSAREAILEVIASKGQQGI